uniref:AlNc14C222G9116 protein n=1 Tax=Albugo laibachii Nc14 TaxID=890382 RepID=F0WRX4_9STRA|nr:AlNc14C222G9116 [Albugo laibachii Nc14]|eukprot:CCA24090.1 AlNc14C222G9116 [Albugo laibachii Nc14]
MMEVPKMSIFGFFFRKSYSLCNSFWHGIIIGIHSSDVSPFSFRKCNIRSYRNTLIFEFSTKYTPESSFIRLSIILRVESVLASSMTIISIFSYA